QVEFILRHFDSVNLSQIDPYLLAECVKAILLRIQEPLIPRNHVDDFLGLLNCEDSESALRGCLNDLAHANRDTLCFMMDHWKRVLAHSLHNGLTISSFATVLAPIVVGFRNEHESIAVMEYLL
ncbi:hypothetical protein PFISCL1PPCAC_5028, partial [Pristionchus fissidentatus]